MMNKDNFILIQTKLKEHDEAATQDFLDSFREELVYELTELFIDRKKEELDKQLHSSKRMKKMLSGFVDNNISYRIGIIMGILETMESLVHRETVQNEVNIKISALFSKETNKKILLYLYDHPGSQHKVIAEALGIRPNYLSQQMRELEEAGGVVRYGVDRRSFYELTLDGQAFIEKNKGRKEHPVFTYDLVKQKGKRKPHMQNNPYQADRIGQIIGMLDEEESGWRRCIKENDESCIKDLERFREYITDLLFEIKEYIKSADSQEKISIQDFIHDGLLADHLMDQAQRLLIHYRAMAPLRILEKDDLHLCQDFFTYAMENYVNRLDMKCLDRFEDYKFQNYEEMQNALESLDVLSGYYVSKSFSGQTIREDFGDETGLSPVLCEHYAKLINESYQTIRLNTIFQKVDLLEKKIDQLLERI